MRFILQDKTSIELKIQQNQGLKVPYKTLYKINNKQWRVFDIGFKIRRLEEIIAKSTTIKELKLNIKNDQG